MVTSRRLDTEDVGPPQQLCFKEMGCSPVIIYGTAYGEIVGWDLRMKELAFNLKNDIREGTKIWNLDILLFFLLN